MSAPANSTATPYQIRRDDYLDCRQAKPSRSQIVRDGTTPESTDDMRTWALSDFGLSIKDPVEIDGVPVDVSIYWLEVPGKDGWSTLCMIG